MIFMSVNSKFKSCFLKSQDNVLDLIFDKLIVTENYFTADEADSLEITLVKTFKKYLEGL